MNWLATMLTASTVMAADNVPSCMTYQQARKIYPNQYLRWTGNHCWYAGTRKRVAAKIKIAAAAPRVETIYPQLVIRNLEIDPLLLSVSPYRLLDVDEIAVDKCCWPPLDVDTNGNPVVPPLPFSERWQELPSVFRRLP